MKVMHINVDLISGNLSLIILPLKTLGLGRDFEDKPVNQRVAGRVTIEALISEINSKSLKFSNTLKHGDWPIN